MNIYDCYFYDGKSANQNSAKIIIKNDLIILEKSDNSQVEITFDKLIRRFNCEKDDIRLSCLEENIKEITLPIDAINSISENATWLHSPPPPTKEHSDKIKKLGIFAWSLVIFIFFILPLLIKPIANLVPIKLEEEIGEAIFVDLKVEDLFSPMQMARHSKDGKDGNCTPNKENGKSCGADFRAISEIAFTIQKRANDIAKQQKFKNSVKISLSDEGTFNAFTLPGGRIIFYCGLLEKIDAEQMSFILAHEMGHVKTRDSMEHYAESIAYGVISSIFSGASLNPNTNFVNNMHGLTYSRGLEERADKNAALMLMDNGYNPQGGPKTFDTFIKEGQDYRFKIDTLFASHPAPKQRQEKLAKLIGSKNGAPLISNDEFAQLKTACE